jgi:uncharacterized protein YecE (DUF72 family)
MEKANHNIRKKFFIGTSGWSYKHWSGIFYPSNVQPNEYLEYYITRYDCVELNSSFYHLPKPTTIEGWLKRTPDSFRICPKLSRFITHQKRLKDVEEPLRRFFDLFETMKSRLGPVLIQLPPGFLFNRSSVTNFLQILKNNYINYRFAFEVRHNSWIADEFMSLLVQHDMAFVIADSGKRFPYHEAVTSDIVYLRFHGPEKLYASDYTNTDLQFYADKIDNWLNNGKEVWVFFNNDFHGYAVKNADTLRNMINLIHK